MGEHMIAQKRGAGAPAWYTLTIAAARAGLVILLCQAQSAAADQKSYPSPGRVTLGGDPLSLLVHYLDGSGTPKTVTLRSLEYDPPQLSESKELRAIGSSPCSRGDVVNVRDSRFEGRTHGKDAAGVGRFVWRLKGQFTSDGTVWRFVGTIGALDDTYDFDPQDVGKRSFLAEVSTRVGAMLPGKKFTVRIQGVNRVQIDGACSATRGGQLVAWLSQRTHLALSMR